MRVVVVACDKRAGDFTFINRRAIERRDDADAVRLHALDAQQCGIESLLLSVPGSDHGEQCRVDTILARGENCELAAFFTAVREERTRVLVVVAIDAAAEDPARRDRLTGIRDDERELALRHVEHGRFQNGILPAPVEEVQAGRERVRLVTGFATQRDDLSRLEILHAEALDDDADIALADEDAAGKEVDADQEQRILDQRIGDDHPEDVDGVCCVHGVWFDDEMF